MENPGFREECGGLVKRDGFGAAEARFSGLKLQTGAGDESGIHIKRGRASQELHFPAEHGPGFEKGRHSVGVHRAQAAQHPPIAILDLVVVVMVMAEAPGSAGVEFGRLPRGIRRASTAISQSRRRR